MRGQRHHDSPAVCSVSVPVWGSGLAVGWQRCFSTELRWEQPEALAGMVLGWPRTAGSGLGPTALPDPRSSARNVEFRFYSVSTRLYLFWFRANLGEDF